MIEIRNITKNFPTVTALHDVSCTIRRGEFFGLLGPNGAGKSTLMNLLVGYLDPDEGEILVNGGKVTRDDVATRRTIGYVPQTVALYDDVSAEDNLEIFGSLFGLRGRVLKERLHELLNAVQLYERRKDKVKTYSGGMKRRLNLAASLLHRPPILLCDEPTVGVDPQSRNAIFDFLRLLNEAGATIIYTTHYMEEAERLCSRIAIIDNGRIIAEGTVDELLDKLPYEESIAIVKSQTTRDGQDVFKQFGSLIDEDDHFELKPRGEFRFSAFFAALERRNIPYRSISLQRPTLEALFLHLTGRSLRD